MDRDKWRVIVRQAEDGKSWRWIGTRGGLLLDRPNMERAGDG